MRNFLLVVHIVAAGTWIGSNIFQLALNRRFTADGGAVAVAWMRATEAAGQVVYGPAGILVLLTGIGLVIDSDVYGFDSGFVGIGMGVIVIGIILGVGVLAPRTRAAEKAFAEGDAARARTLMARITGFGLLDTALILFAVVAMVGRWGA